MSHTPTRRKVSRRTKRGIHPLVIILLCAMLFSAGVASLWQLGTPAVAKASSMVIDATLLMHEASCSSPETLPVPSGPEPPPVSISHAASAASSDATIDTAAGVTRGERVTSSYFDDAAFVGDSLTTGIQLYDIMSNAHVFAGTGISLENIFTKEVIKQGESKVTILNALKASQSAKIYIMIGANSLGASQEWALTEYAKLIDTVKTQNPNSIIYIQSVLPLYEPTFKIRYNTGLTNAQIDTFNVQLAALAAQKEVYYLDVASAFKDKNGAMPQDYTPDGLHINSAQYLMWFDYLKTHAVQK